MAYEQMLAPVLEKQALAKNIYRMVLQCRSIAQKAEPGQFVHLLPQAVPCAVPSLSVRSTSPER